MSKSSVLNDEAHSRAVQFAIGMSFALEILGEQHVARTEYARAARAGYLDRTRDRDDELALLWRVIFALRSRLVLAKQQPFYRHRGRAVLRVPLHQDRVERQRQILEMRAVVRPGIDANHITFPHASSPRILTDAARIPEKFTL